MSVSDTQHITQGTTEDCSLLCIAYYEAYCEAYCEAAASAGRQLVPLNIHGLGVAVDADAAAARAWPSLSCV